MLAFLALAMGLPLLFLLVGSFNLATPGKAAVYGLDNWMRAFSDPGTISALWMSFLLSVVRLIPAMILSVLVAWLIARTDMPGGRTIESLCWIAYFIPDFPLTRHSPTCKLLCGTRIRMQAGACSGRMRPNPIAYTGGRSS